MPLPPVLLELVERFENNKEAYTSLRYNEAQVRREFIDPFFRQLGWDLITPADTLKLTVVHEDSLKIGETSKAPDYGFRIGGTRKFFLEAKSRPETSQMMPNLPTSSGVTPGGRSCPYPSLRILERSRSMIAGLSQRTFSRDAILKGAFDKFAADASKKKGTSEVDDAFLEDIEAWREAPALDWLASPAGETSAAEPPAFLVA
jgi:hypothetical protein